MDKHVIDARYKGAVAIACSALILFSKSMFAQSSPPLLSNDPGTPGPGKWEINILTSLERSDVEDAWLLPLFDINYGVGNRCQLTASIPYVVDHQKSSGVSRTFNGMELGIKYRFVDNHGTKGSNISVSPMIYYSFEEESSTEWSLPVEWHMEWSHFGLTAEVGHLWVHGKSDGWGGGVGAALFIDPVALLAELHTGAREAPFDLRDPMVNVGLTYKLSECVSMFASFGKSVHKHEEEINTWCLAGFQFQF